VSLRSFLYLSLSLEMQLTSRNYTQLGLAHTTHSAEILYNLGLTKIYLGQIAAGMLDLRKAQEEKSEPDHEVIGDCIRDHGRGYNVFSVPVRQSFTSMMQKLICSLVCCLGPPKVNSRISRRGIIWVKQYVISSSTHYLPFHSLSPRSSLAPAREKS
jgi:hypothetical protein